MNNLLGDLDRIQGSEDVTRGSAWYSLLEMIARRESYQLEGTDAETILRFICRLAVASHHADGGRRAFSATEVEAIFYNVTGKAPADEDRFLLLRLPGLGTAPEKLGSRDFVDLDFCDAAAALEYAEFASHPYSVTDRATDLSF